jgi:hypothetical protein
MAFSSNFRKGFISLWRERTSPQNLGVIGSAVIWSSQLAWSDKLQNKQDQTLTTALAHGGGKGLFIGILITPIKNNPYTAISVSFVAASIISLLEYGVVSYKNTKTTQR